MANKKIPIDSLVDLVAQTASDKPVKGTISYTSQYAGGGYDVVRTYSFSGNSSRDYSSGYDSTGEVKDEALNNAISYFESKLTQKDNLLKLYIRDRKDSSAKVEIKYG